MNSHTKDVLNRLKTVKGHVAGIEKMIEDGKACGDILLQLGAIKASINKVSGIISEHYALECYDQAVSQGEDPKEVLKRAIRIVVKNNS
jgi:CsoR family transcriptional regulator, copper-sensing transcriptional repressor